MAHRGTVKLRPILATLFFGIGLYILLRPFAEDLFLKLYGQCFKAVIINKTIHIRYNKPDYKYQFWMIGQPYEGNSLITDPNKVGDTVCVVYLKKYPSVNRPVIYFSNFDACTCK
jgi:hypothetical protein